MKRLILASNSPRRKEILTKLGFSFEVMPSFVDESFSSKLDVYQNVMLTAKHKANDIYNKNQDADVIGADTIVVYNNIVFGKPKSEEAARRMLRILSDNTHQVITGVCIIKDGKEYNYYEESIVKFNKISEEDIDWYIETKEPMDKAGAYAIQGLGSKFVKYYNGEFETIVGLPINRLKQIFGN